MECVLDCDDIETSQNQGCILLGYADCMGENVVQFLHWLHGWNTNANLNTIICWGFILLEHTISPFEQYRISQ